MIATPQSELEGTSPPRVVRRYRVVSLLLLALCFVPTSVLIDAISTRHFYNIIFWLILGVPLSGLLLLAGVLPNAVLFRKYRSPVSRQGVWIAACGLALLCVQLSLFWLVPLDHAF